MPVDYLPKRPRLETPSASWLPLSTSSDLLSVDELSSPSPKTPLYPVRSLLPTSTVSRARVSVLPSSTLSETIKNTSEWVKIPSSPNELFEKSIYDLSKSPRNSVNHGHT
jgi:hypothetical protein